MTDPGEMSTEIADKTEGNEEKIGEENADAAETEMNDPTFQSIIPINKSYTNTNVDYSHYFLKSRLKKVLVKSVLYFHK